MINELLNINFFPKSPAEIIFNISVALICGLMIAWLYRKTYQGPGFSTSFVNSIVLLSMITAVVIMVIGNNLARAFGLVGAMSIIRFRTAVKETQDIVFIFFGLAVGMAAGVGYHKIALIGTIFIGGVILLFSKYKIATPYHEEYLLQFTFIPEEGEKAGYIPVIDRHCRRHKVINVKSLGQEDQLELSFFVRLKDKSGTENFIKDLRQINGVDHINLYFDEEHL